MAVLPLSPTLGLNRSIAESRDLLGQLQEQLASGKKVKTYGDLGIVRNQILSFRSEISQINGFLDTSSQADIRLDVMLQSLERMRELASETKSDALEVGFEVQAGGQTVYQIEVGARLDEVTALLNTKVGDRYLFSGTETGQRPVLSAGEILDGVGARAGLKQIVSERRQADLGADSRGRLVLDPPVGGTATLAEDAAGSPFGFKLASATSTLTGTTVIGPAGAPPSLDVAFSGTLPQDGETVRFTFDLPDGTQHDLTLTARDSGPLLAGEFLVGADAAATAANFQAALTSAVETEAQRSLSAASLFAAADDFFDFDAANPPQRVDGPPFDSATALRDATATDTVFWYQGEVSSASARQSALAKIDDSTFTAYGARANEEAFRTVLKNFAAMAVETSDPNDANAPDRYHEMKLRASDGLTFAGGQSVDGVITELAVAKTTIGRAAERHEANLSMLQGFIDQEESADTFEVSTQILALQGRIEASLQVSVSLSRLSLINFL